MVKAKFKYSSYCHSKVVKILLDNDAKIEKMYESHFDISTYVVCVFKDSEHMNDVFGMLNDKCTSGIYLVSYSNIFDFKKWWKGEK